MITFTAVITFHLSVVWQYVDTTVTQMSEAWEDILLEMDSKLKKLAEDKYVRFNCFYSYLYRDDGHKVNRLLFVVF